MLCRSYDESIDSRCGLPVPLYPQAMRGNVMNPSSESFQSATEAVRICRGLARQNPETHLPRLASAIQRQAAYQTALGQDAAALESMIEAVRIYDQVARQNPQTYLVDLCRALSILGDRLAEHGRISEARDAAAKSLLNLAQFFPRPIDDFHDLARATLKKYITRCDQSRCLAPWGSPKSGHLWSPENRPLRGVETFTPTGDISLCRHGECLEQRKARTGDSVGAFGLAPAAD